MVWSHFQSFPHLEKQWEAKQEGTVSRASELWNVSGTCGWIRYHEGQGRRLLLSKVTWSQTQHHRLGAKKRSSAGRGSELQMQPVMI